MRPRLDRLFARFRARGDARALAKIFDATASELYRVATHLMRDLHAAEDLVQSTFLAAIEARESWDESQSVMPWLIGILARQAAFERRRRSRVIEPERLESRETSEPVQALEAQELSHELARAIDGLPALYREVLIAHLRQGKTPQEIARDLGRAPGTVRVQLHRALEMVRKALPVGLATGALVAALSPKGLSAVRSAVLRSAMRVSAPVAATAAVAPAAATIGGLVMSAKSVLTVTGLVVCLAFIGRIALRRSGPERVDVNAAALSATSLAPSFSTDAEERASASLTAPEASHRVLAAAAKGSSGSDLAVQVLGAQVSGHLLMPDGSPASGAFVALVRMKEGRPRESTQEGKTETDGAFVLRGDPGPCLVVGLQENFLPFARQVVLVPNSDLHLDPVAFSEGAHIRGHVRILDAPAPRDCVVVVQRQADGPTIRLHDQDLLWSEGALHVLSRSSHTDDLGRVAIGGLEPETHRVYVESTPERRILHATVFDVVASTDDVDLNVQGVRLVLRVLSDHQPLDAKVMLNEGGHGQGNVWGFGSQSAVDVLVPAGTVYDVDVEKEGFTSASLQLETPGAGETMEKEVELHPRTDGAEIAIELVIPDGSQIHSAGFGFFRTTSSAVTFDARFGMLRLGSEGREPDIVRDEKADDGVFRLSDLPTGRYKVEVMAGGTWNDGGGYWHSDPIEVELGSNASERRRMELRMGGRFRIRCVNRKGEALPANCKAFDRGGSEIPLVFFTRDGHGSTWQGNGALNSSAPRGANEAFPNLLPGPYELRFSLGGYRESAQTVTVEAGRVRDVSIILEDG